MASAPPGGRKPVGFRPIALDGGYGWWVVLGSFLIHVFADGFVYSFGVLAETLVKEFNGSNTEVSLILSLLTGLMLAAGPLASAICNRIGCRITTIIGAVIASIGCAISYKADSMGYLIFSVGIVMGVGFGLMYCPAIVIVTMYFERLRALATGITVCGAGVGTFVFSRIIAFLLDNFDWQTVFIIYAGVVLLCVPCGMLYRPIEFEPIYDDDEEMIEIKKNGKVDHGKDHHLDLHVPEPIAEEDEEKASPQGVDDKKELIAPAINNNKPVQNGQVKVRPAISHSALNEDPEKGAGKGNLTRYSSLGFMARTSRSNTFSESSGYLNVKDVFYTGSVRDLPEYNKEGEKFRSVSSLHSHGTTGHKEKLHGKEMSLDNQPIAEEDENLDSQATSASRAIAIWGTIKKMVDFSLFADPIYVLFAVSNFLTSIGFNAPPMFMPMNAEVVLKLSKAEASNSISAYGAANFFGRIVFGLVCDRAFPFKYGKDRARNRLWIYNVSLMIIGVASVFVYAMDSAWIFNTYCFVFGFFISSYVCLTSVVLVDLIGVDRLTNAFGLLLLVQGIATFVGPPFCGKLYDIFKNYDWTFVFCGICLFVSGIMLFAIPFMKKSSKSVRLESEPAGKRPLLH